MIKILEADIWYPNCESEDSIDRVIQRVIAVQDLVSGKLSPDTFLDILDSQGFKVYDLLDLSENDVECYR